MEKPVSLRLRTEIQQLLPEAMGSPNPFLTDNQRLNLQLYKFSVKASAKTVIYTVRSNSAQQKQGSAFSRPGILKTFSMSDLLFHIIVKRDIQSSPALLKLITLSARFFVKYWDELTLYSTTLYRICTKINVTSKTPHSRATAKASSVALQQTHLEAKISKSGLGYIIWQTLSFLSISCLYRPLLPHRATLSSAVI